jgi:hypothetical protein
VVTGSRTVTAEGLSNKEIMRCLKRYIAREVYPTSAAPLTDGPDSGDDLTLYSAAAPRCWPSIGLSAVPATPHWLR